MRSFACYSSIDNCIMIKIVMMHRVLKRTDLFMSLKIGLDALRCVCQPQTTKHAGNFQFRYDEETNKKNQL